VGSTWAPTLSHTFYQNGFTSNITISRRYTNAPDRSLELAETKGAIMVSPAYRLLPEASGSEILEDVKDFWEWVYKSLPTFVAEKWPGLTLDLDRTAALGESAGGYLALQSAFLFPSANIKAVMAQYCAIYPDIEWYPRPAEPPAEANAIVEAYVSQIKPGAIRLSSPFPALVDFGVALKQTGRHREWMGDDERLTINYCLRTTEKMPPIWIMQGTDDQIVSLATNINVEKN
jgi:acetyl esterase/lipase